MLKNEIISLNKVKKLVDINANFKHFNSDFSIKIVRDNEQPSQEEGGDKYFYISIVDQNQLDEGLEINWKKVKDGIAGKHNYVTGDYINHYIYLKSDFPVNVMLNLKVEEVKDSGDSVDKDNKDNNNNEVGEVGEDDQPQDLVEKLETKDGAPPAFVNNKVPFYRKLWFKIFVFFVIIIVLIYFYYPSSSSTSSTTSTSSVKNSNPEPESYYSSFVSGEIGKEKEFSFTSSSTTDTSSNSSSSSTSSETSSSSSSTVPDSVPISVESVTKSENFYDKIRRNYRNRKIDLTL